MYPRDKWAISGIADLTKEGSRGEPYERNELVLYLL